MDVRASLDFNTVILRRLDWVFGETDRWVQTGDTPSRSHQNRGPLKPKTVQKMNGWRYYLEAETVRFSLLCDEQKEREEENQTLLRQQQTNKSIHPSIHPYDTL